MLPEGDGRWMRPPAPAAPDARDAQAACDVQGYLDGHGRRGEPGVREQPVPRLAGQPVAAVVPEERGLSRVHAFARRWRALRFHQERGRTQLAPHDLCGVACTGLTSRCVRQMEREGFLSAIRPEPRG